MGVSLNGRNQPGVWAWSVFFCGGDVLPSFWGLDHFRGRHLTSVIFGVWSILRVNKQTWTCFGPNRFVGFRTWLETELDLQGV